MHELNLTRIFIVVCSSSFGCELMFEWLTSLFILTTTDLSTEMSKLKKGSSSLETQL